MKPSFADVFARHESPYSPQGRVEASQALETAVHDATRVLLACSPALREDLLATLSTRVRALLEETDARARELSASPEGTGTGGTSPNGSGTGPREWLGVTDGRPWGKVPPELLVWARQNTNEEEIIAAMREVEETGGLEFRDFIDELEKAARPDE
jgi:hypothetical protein